VKGEAMNGVTTGIREDEGETRALRDARIRVLHVVDTMEPGGAQMVVLGLTRWLASKGGVAAVFGNGGQLVNELAGGVSWFDPHDEGFLPQVVALIRCCRRFRPDVLHAHQRREALLCLIVGRLLSIPVVEHAHTYLPDRRFAALSFRSARIFAVSNQVVDMVVQRFRRPGARVVFTGNTASRVSVAAPTSSEWKADEALRVVGIGRLVPQKDPLRFVRIVAEYAREHAVVARWLGEGPLLHEARTLANELGAPVTFAGQSDDVTRELDDAHVLLMTSQWEGMPLVVLEAFARRRPVIATEAVGTSGVLGHGRALVVSDDAAESDFVRALVAATSPSNREALSEMLDAALDYATTVASPDRVFQPVLQAYRELVSASSLRARGSDRIPLAQRRR
jgi:glycosyltransferase involved in cell wall biosynthesis